MSEWGNIYTGIGSCKYAEAAEVVKYKEEAKSVLASLLGAGGGGSGVGKHKLNIDLKVKVVLI